MKSGYRGLVIALVVLIILSNLSEGFIEPIAFVLKTETNKIWEYVAGAAALIFTLLISRFINREFIHGYLERSLDT